MVENPSWMSKDSHNLPGRSKNIAQTGRKIIGFVEKSSKIVLEVEIAAS